MRNHKQHVDNPFKNNGLMVGIEEAHKIGELSKTAVKLYLHIREYSFRTKGYLLFDFSMAKELCGFKQNKSVYNALNELVDANILAGMKDSCEFYYNPKFINHERE